MARMPFVPSCPPGPGTLAKERCRRMTTSPAPALMFAPFVPVMSALARNPPPSIVIDLVIGIDPKPPGSRASISPPGFVFEMAPAKVLHGVGRWQLFASSPRADKKVRSVCALATQRGVRKKPNKAAHLGIQFCLFIRHSFFVLVRPFLSGNR